MSLDSRQYYKGFEDGLQEALDIVNKAADWAQRHNGDNANLNIYDILARIITDIQVAKAV